MGKGRGGEREGEGVARVTRGLGIGKELGWEIGEAEKRSMERQKG